MERVREKRKFSRNIIVSIVFVVFCLFIWFSSLPCSYVNLKINIAHVKDGQEIYLQGVDEEDGHIRETEKIQNGVVTFSLKEYEKIKEARLVLGDQDKAVLQQVRLYSRDHYLYKWNSDCAKREVLKNGKVVYTFSEQFIEQYSKVYDNDWKLKRDILLPLIILFLLLESLFWMWRLSKPSPLQVLAISAGIVIILGLILLFYTHTKEEAYCLESLEIVGEEYLDPITEKEVYKQSFYAKKPVRGLQVFCATFGRIVESHYRLNVYDADTNNLVLQQDIKSSVLKDNEYADIWFDQTLEGKRAYTFSIVRTKDKGDDLTFWTNENNIYDSGNLFIDGKQTRMDISFNIIEKGPNRIFWLLLFAGIFGCILVLIFSYRKFFIPENAVKVTIYALILVFCVTKMIFYSDNFELYSYDEMAHVSYIAYLEKNSDEFSFVPKYEDMTMLMNYNRTEEEDPKNVYPLLQREGDFSGKFTGTVNYLGHPQLYYQMMRLTNCVLVDDDKVTVDLDLLRRVNMCLLIIGLILMFYIGYTRIPYGVCYHLLYGATCACIPILCFLGPIITNDNLLWITVGLFVLGALRFTENKRDVGTYFLIAIGICLTTLTKTTAGLIVLGAALAFLVWIMVAEKSLKPLLNWRMLATIPLYLFVLAYFIGVHANYGTFQPTLSTIDYKQFIEYPVVYHSIENRPRKEFWEYIRFFCSQFLGQWTQGVMWEKAYSGWACSGMLFLWIGLIIFSTKTIYKKIKEQKAFLFTTFTFAIYITALSQMFRSFRLFQYVSGQGSTQSRYYVCFIPIFALVLVELIGKCLHKDTTFLSFGEKAESKITKMQIGNLICILYTIMIVYSDVIYNLMNCIKY